MTLNNEIKDLILNTAPALQIIDDWGPLAEELFHSFEWKGSKIDWSKVSTHKIEKLLGDYLNWVV